MSSAPSVRPFGGHAFLLELPDQGAVHRTWARLAEARRLGSALLAGVEEVVAGARTILVVTDPDRTDPGLTAGRISEWLTTEVPGQADEPAGGGAPSTAREIEIPVVYDGPDLGEVAGLTGLSPAEVVSRHTGATWTVGFLGFAPGFAYLAGGDPALAVPRRRQPRPAVGAGAVGLAGGMSAVYPTETPGGWQLIGRTDLILFDPTREPPALLAPGDRVRFVPVERLAGLPHPPASDPAALRPGGHAGPVIEVIHPGPATTVQDRGRVGHAHEGVPRAGAVDRVALEAANALVGNPAGAAIGGPGAAALESTLGGPTLRFPAGGLVAVAGAEASVTVDGKPVSGFPVRVPPGSVLAVGTARRGVRTYVAVAGGVAVAPVLGSRSADTLSGLGPRALRAGDVIPVGVPGPAGPAGREPGLTPRGAPGPPGFPTPSSGKAEVVTVRAMPGPRADWLVSGQLGALFGAEMTVSPVSDRVGLRTEGLQLALHHRGELPSEGMVAGAVQVPPGGQPIVLLANHATTGGYPVVAVVSHEDLPLLAQARPGWGLRMVRAGDG